MVRMAIPVNTSPNEKPSIVAEIAKNHRGSMELAKKLIVSCRDAGATHVKFQAYDIEKMNKEHPNYPRYKDCWLHTDKLRELAEFASNENIGFYCSVFNKSLIPELAQFTRDIKVPSTYANMIPFRESCQKHFDRVHVSFGMNPVFIMSRTREIPYWCVSMYPVEFPRLFHIRAYASKWSHVGYSCHSSRPVLHLAWMLGATWLERHVNVPENAKPWEDTPESLKKQIDMIDETMELCRITRVPSKVIDNMQFFKAEFPGEFKTY